jgi:hypothetical protein
MNTTLYQINTGRKHEDVIQITPDIELLDQDESRFYSSSIFETNVSQLDMNCLKGVSKFELFLVSSLYTFDFTKYSFQLSYVGIKELVKKANETSEDQKIEIYIEYMKLNYNYDRYKQMMVKIDSSLSFVDQFFSVVKDSNFMPLDLFQISYMSESDSESTTLQYRQSYNKLHGAELKGDVIDEAKLLKVNKAKFQKLPSIEQSFLTQEFQKMYNHLIHLKSLQRIELSFTGIKKDLDTIASFENAEPAILEEIAFFKRFYDSHCPEELRLDLIELNTVDSIRYVMYFAWACDRLYKEDPDLGSASLFKIEELMHVISSEVFDVSFIENIEKFIEWEKTRSLEGRFKAFINQKFDDYTPAGKTLIFNLSVSVTVTNFPNIDKLIGGNSGDKNKIKYWINQNVISGNLDIGRQRITEENIYPMLPIVIEGEGDSSGNGGKSSNEDKGNSSPGAGAKKQNLESVNHFASIQNFLVSNFTTAKNRIGGDAVFEIFLEYYEEAEIKSLSFRLQGKTSALDRLNIKSEIEKRIPELTEINAPSKNLGEILGEISDDDYLDIALNFEKNVGSYKAESPADNVIFGLYNMVKTYIRTLNSTESSAALKYNEFLGGSFATLSNVDRGLLAKKAEEKDFGVVYAKPEVVPFDEEFIEGSFFQKSISTKSGAKSERLGSGEQAIQSTNYISSIVEQLLDAGIAYKPVTFREGAEAKEKFIIIPGYVFVAQENAATHILHNPSFRIEALKSKMLEFDGDRESFPEFAFRCGFKYYSYDHNNGWKDRQLEIIKGKFNGWSISMPKLYEDSVLRDLNMLDYKTLSAMCNQMNNYEKCVGLRRYFKTEDVEGLVTSILDLKNTYRVNTTGQDDQLRKAAGILQQKISEGIVSRENQFVFDYIEALQDYIQFLAELEKFYAIYIAKSSVEANVKMQIPRIYSTFNNLQNYKGEKSLIEKYGRKIDQNVADLTL